LKNWKTTITGLTSAVASFVILSDQLADKPLYFRLATFILSGGLAFLGISAKDSGGDNGKS